LQSNQRRKPFGVAQLFFESSVLLMLQHAEAQLDICGKTEHEDTAAHVAELEAWNSTLNNVTLPVRPVP